MKKCILSLLLFVFIAANIQAYEATQYDFRRTFTFLNSLRYFQGDRHGSFVGDTVAILSDGSQWKVHPKDKDKFGRWLANEIVHPEVRQDFYLIKREHKFALHNHNRNESVRAMLVQYPSYPLMIIDSHCYIADTKIHMVKEKQEDGSVTYVPRVFQKREKRVVLSDGTIWKLREKIDWRMKNAFEQFTIGSTVYLGCNTTCGKFRFFVITGLEREAVYNYAKY